MEFGGYRRRAMPARVTLRAGETTTFVLDRVERGEMPVPYSDADMAAAFDAIYHDGWMELTRNLEWLM